MPGIREKLIKIKEIENEISELKKQLHVKTLELHNLNASLQVATDGDSFLGEDLTKDDILRYSRQMIVPLIGCLGQKKLKKAGVLIVGCGGLGCPAAQYLAGCGVGTLGLIDYDVVEHNNLHRQLLHSEFNVGVPKVKSLAQALLRLNSNLRINEYNLQLSSSNALNIFVNYDVVIDASDNVATRYLVNDACVIANLPLVSGSAVSSSGQLTVYNYQEGPCYRCLFPSPPPPEVVSNCSDVGVLGPVPGCIGVLQALQAVHIITGNGKVLSKRLLLFDGEENIFRTIKLREKATACTVCGPNPSITELIDYEQFCGSPANDKGEGLRLLDVSQRVSPLDLKTALDRKDPFLLIDVRSTIEFEMCRIQGSINVPLNELSKEEVQRSLEGSWNNLIESCNLQKPTVYVVCRRGNDSQLGLKQLELILPRSAKLYDVVGGLHAWSRDVDSTFPAY